jgi:cytochrome c oxidase subunit 2
MHRPAASSTFGPMRRGVAFQLLIFGLIAGAAGMTLALVPGWLPDAASTEAGRIHFVFWFVTVICVFVFAVVTAAMVYTVLRFRRRPDDEEDGPPIHGHTGLEIGWTVVPTILVTAIGVVSAIVLARDDHVGKNPLRVHVIAQQFAWSYQYPKELGGQTVNTLRLPVDRSVVLDFEAKDVIHSFWVPEFSQKQDTVPGLHPTLHITPRKLGTYPVICTELCGLGHSLMRSAVIVMPKAKFAAWVTSQTKALGGSGSPAAAGATVFKNNGCNACHTLLAAGATGKVGPDLDKLPAFAKEAGQPLDTFVKESITDPNAYVEKGFPKNVMPSFKSLPPDQLDALVQYLVSSSKGGK